MRSLDGMLTEDDNGTARPCPDSHGVVDTIMEGYEVTLMLIAYDGETCES